MDIAIRNALRMLPGTLSASQPNGFNPLTIIQPLVQSLPSVIGMFDNSGAPSALTHSGQDLVRANRQYQTQKMQSALGGSLNLIFSLLGMVL
jgi:hypothetical protein